MAYPYVGGGESYVIQLSKSLIDVGHEVHWLASRIPNTTKEETFEGIKIHRVPILFKNRYLFPGRHTFSAMSIIPGVKLAKEMDVLQFNTFVASLSGALIGKFARKPTLLFCHELFLNMWKKVGINFLERNLNSRVEKVIARSPYDWIACPSEYSKRTLITAGAPEEKITTIPHGLDIGIFNPSADGSGLRRKYRLQDYKLFGFTGRINIKEVGRSKNVMGLLKAAKIVTEHVPKSKLVLGGRIFDDITPVFKKLGIENKVAVLGHRPFNEVPKFLRMCDTIVCPAFSDGYCFQVAEASACGVPVVATDAGSHSERIKDGVNGVLTDTTPEGIADGIIKVLSNEKLARKLGKSGAEMYKKMSWKNVVKKYVKMYESMINGK